MAQQAKETLQENWIWAFFILNLEIWLSLGEKETRDIRKCYRSNYSVSR